MFAKIDCIWRRNWENLNADCPYLVIKHNDDHTYGLFWKSCGFNPKLRLYIFALIASENGIKASHISGNCHHCDKESCIYYTAEFRGLHFFITVCEQHYNKLLNIQVFSHNNIIWCNSNKNIGNVVITSIGISL